MTFATQKLVGERVLVNGSDSYGHEGSCVLDSTQWTEVNGSKAWSLATADFDKAVHEFFAPIEAAIDALGAATKPKEKDPASYVVLQEPVVGVPAQPGNLVHLTHDSIVLRLLESGQHNRLVWVDNTLEILELSTPAAPAAPAPVDAEFGDEVDDAS